VAPARPTCGPSQALVDRYVAVRGLTEQLAAPLSAEDQTVQSMPDASPTKWHRAHTSWFFETFVLSARLTDYQPFHPAFGYLFNSYYEAVGVRHPRPHRGLLSRPGIDEIAAYRRHVDTAMTEVLRTALTAEVGALVELGLSHEQQHQELLIMDVKHLLSVNPLRPSYRPLAKRQPSVTSPPAWVDHAGGLVEIGHSGSGFSFDNETPRHLAYVAPFSLASITVSCGDWLAFMDDGGYRRPELWLSEGWATVQAERWEAPLYWFQGDGTWGVFTLGGPRAVDPTEPACHVSYFEADAYARWCGARLPTEVEWEAMAPRQADNPAGFLELDVLHPRPAPPGTGLRAMFGDVWEWTSSAYLPYPGFQPAAGVVGEYNGKFMVNQHVLRGGCCATPAGHVRPTYRNFFPPVARWPFAGVRLARDL
jgi:ergothioneine biosynthesis protein EgtB